MRFKNERRGDAAQKGEIMDNETLLYGKFLRDADWDGAVAAFADKNDLRIARKS
jgi:hypothetical protein